MAKLRRMYHNTTATELSIDSHGYNFLTLVGSHVNGGYIAFLNWGVCAEISDDWNDTFYNSKKMSEVFETIRVLSPIADEIAKEISLLLKEHSDIL